MQVVIILFCLIGLVITVFFNGKRRKLVKRLRKAREPITYNDFYDMLEVPAFSQELSRILCGRLMRKLKMKNFFIYPDDNLYELVAFDREEYKDLINDVCLKLNVRYPRRHELKGYEEEYSEILTPKDMIYFISHFNQLYN
ncbi:MAG: hypothetical protein AB8B61_05275 [Cyclobacteriaceae bacterium]